MNTGHPTIIYDPTERARLESRRDRQRDMAEPVKLMWEPPSGRETQMDKLRKTINLKYGLDLGESCSTVASLLRADVHEQSSLNS